MLFATAKFVKRIKISADEKKNFNNTHCKTNIFLTSILSQ